MLIIAKQDNIDNLYAIWNTVTDRFIGANLGYNECIGKLMDYKNCSYEDAKSRVDHPQPFDDIAEHICREFDPYYVLKEQRDIRNAVSLVIEHYKTDENFRNAFISSIKSALRETSLEDGLHETAKTIADRIIGEG